MEWENGKSVCKVIYIVVSSGDCLRNPGCLQHWSVFYLKEPPSTLRLWISSVHICFSKFYSSKFVSLFLYVGQMFYKIRKKHFKLKAMPSWTRRKGRCYIKFLRTGSNCTLLVPEHFCERCRANYPPFRRPFRWRRSKWYFHLPTFSQCSLSLFWSNPWPCSAPKRQAQSHLSSFEPLVL